MSTANTPGCFITLEGIEGAGKTTHMNFIADLFRERGKPVILTREPGGTQLGESIRNVLLSTGNSGAISDTTELLLMFAARSQHLDEIIRPGLADGATVISDRFTDSSFAYQGGGRGIDTQRIEQLRTWLHADVTPDLTLLLDLPVILGLERVGKRGASDRFEAEKLEFFTAVRNCYLNLAAAEPHRFAVIDASRSVDEIQACIQTVLQERDLL